MIRAGHGAGEHIFETDRTVIQQCLALALVSALLGVGHAEPAGVAVEIVRLPADSTDVARATVVDLFPEVVVVVEFADWAIVTALNSNLPRELERTLTAFVRDGLDVLAFQTFYGLHVVSVQLMSFFNVFLTGVFGIVVAKSTREKLKAYWTLFVTTTFVVAAFIYRLLRYFNYRFL